MKSKKWWVLLVFIITSTFSTYYYICKIKGHCDKTQVTQEIKKEPTKPAPKKEPVKEVKLGPIVYHWSKVSEATNDLWPAFKSKIMEAKAAGKKLEIVGPYYSDEENTTEFDNIGLARAESVKQRFINDVDPNLIMTRGRLMKTGAVNARKNPFSGEYINWIVNNKNVKEVDGKALIYFPSASAKEIKNKDILDYLDNLAKQLIANKTQQLRITGHTDTDGNEKANEILGLKRAKKIKANLVKKGVDGERIFATSRGEMEPIASNKTKEGKQKNRRVEIRITK